MRKSIVLLVTAPFVLAPLTTIAAITVTFLTWNPLLGMVVYGLLFMVGMELEERVGW